MLLKLSAIWFQAYEALRQHGVIESFRSLNGTVPIALDGTWYGSSQNLNCDNCSFQEHKNGDTTYYHSAVTPVIVAPNQPHAISLRPEFILPQDGHAKQDCEINASKRWLQNNAAYYAPLKATLLGDDLYSRQPFCRQTLLHGFHFLFVCKPDSHTTLYDFVALLKSGGQLRTLKKRCKVNGHWQDYAYSYANQVPLAEGDDALKVNWCEVTVSNDKGQVIYRNGFNTLFFQPRWRFQQQNESACHHCNIFPPRTKAISIC